MVTGRELIPSYHYRTIRAFVERVVELSIIGSNNR